jgi:arginase
LPVVLTGNCYSQQAVVAGLGTDGLGLVWLDCHADFNTPETTESGYFDGYGLAMVVGNCWQTLCATVPGFTPLRQDAVLLAGVRGMEAGERKRLDRGTIRCVGPSHVGCLADLLAHFEADRISLHVALDVLDPAYGHANRYAVPPVMTPDELIAAVSALARDRELAALTLSAYDPSYDSDGCVRDSAVAVLEAAASA